MHVGSGGGGDVTWLGRVAVLTCVGAPTVRVAVALWATLIAVAVVVSLVSIVVALVAIVAVVAAAASLASSLGILILLVDLSL